MWMHVFTGRLNITYGDANIGDTAVTQLEAFDVFAHFDHRADSFVAWDQRECRDKLAFVDMAISATNAFVHEIVSADTSYDSDVLFSPQQWTGNRHQYQDMSSESISSLPLRSTSSSPTVGMGTCLMTKSFGFEKKRR